MKMKSMPENRGSTSILRGRFGGVWSRLGRAASNGRFQSIGTAVLLALRSWAAPGDADPAFNVPPIGGGFPTAISAVAVQPDGKILLGGNFTTVWGAERSGIARLNVDGSLEPDFAPTNVPPDVRAIAVQTDGGVVLGIGYPTASTPSLMRLNSDGSTDTNFTSGFASWSAYLRGALAILVQPDGKILAGGGTVPGGAGYLLRLQPTGALDGPFTRVANGIVEAFALAADGRLYIAGAFSSPRPGLALLATNGTAAPFLSDISTNAIVHTVVVQPDGRLLAGGKFVRSGTVDGRTNMIRLAANGAFDSTFNAGQGPNGEVRSIALLTNNTMLVAGDFTTFAGQPCAGLVRLQPNGQLDTGFSTASVAGLSRPVVALQNDGLILVGGAGTNGHPLIRLLGGAAVDAAPTVVVQPSHQRVTVGQTVQLTAFVTSAARFSCGWDLDGTPLSTATNATLTLTNMGVAQTGTYTITVSNALGTATSSASLEVVALSTSVGKLDLSYNSGTRPQVMDGIFAATLQPDGGTVLGGGFYTFNGVRCTNLARVDASGNVDTNFNSGRLAYGAYPDWVQGLVRQDDGKLIAVGRFPARIFRFDTLGARDLTFLSSSLPLLYAVALQQDGRVLVGGSAAIRRLTPTGNYDATFNAGAGPNTSVRAIAVQPDGRILAGGDFTTWSGTARPGLVRLNAGGDLDFSFDAHLTGEVAAVVVQLDGKVLVGGNFQGAGGAARSGLARLNPDGSVDAAYASGSGFYASAPNPRVVALALQPDGKLLVGGGFTSVDGAARRAITRLNPDGRVDPTFNPGTGPDGGVYALALQPDGNVIIAGDFNNVNGSPRDRLARLFGDHPPPIAPQLSIAMVAGGQVGISFVSEPGRQFTLEVGDSLIPTQWTPGPSLLGDGNPMTLSDTNTPSLRRFYRVRAE